jgi:NADH:ubiquinone oxidoreductase subunit 5 (subunit L)/multisubunit Na+/H+ antiporter MnhA subunit
VPDEHTAHAFHGEATLYAFLTAMGGLGLAVAFYGMRWLSPSEVRSQFSQVYRLLWNRWWFDEMYDVLLVRPVHLIAKFTAMFDRRIIDGIVDGCARVTLWVSKIDDAIDRYGVDWLIDVIGNSTHSLGLTLRAAQTGRLRQYVLFVVIATVALFVVISFAVAGR